MAKKTTKKAVKKSALTEDVNLEGQDSLVKELPEEDDDVIVAHPRQAGELRVTKLAPRPKVAAKKDDGSKRDADKPVKADFDAAHKALDLARELSEQQVAREAEGDARRMKRHLAEQPTTKFMIPFGIGERHGAVETVTLNGYRLSIKKGVLVEIPVPVAEVLMGYLNVRSDVAEKFALHRDEATEEALS